jgi:hypothetical protein
MQPPKTVIPGYDSDYQNPSANRYPLFAILSPKKSEANMTLDEYDEATDGTLLKIEAEIISKDPEGFEIRVSNSETGRTETFDTVRGYAEFLIESVNHSKMDNFIATWLPSPHARRYDIDLVGMQLSMMQEWMEKELGDGDGPLPLV